MDQPMLAVYSAGTNPSRVWESQTPDHPPHHHRGRKKSDRPRHRFSN